jgi:5-methylcytosine-specific restriction endonuclease McrA
MTAIPPRVAPGGFCDERELPRGPNGRALCRKCGKEVPRARMTFCSPECVHEWKLRTQPGYAAAQVLKRDAGVCADCGIDCLALLADLKRFRQQHRKDRWLKRAPHPEVPTLPHEYEDGSPLAIRCDELELPRSYRSLTRRLWEADHIIPVAEGGGSCGLENLRTLCWRCHRRVTAALRKRLAAKKRDSPRLGAD